MNAFLVKNFIVKQELLSSVLSKAIARYKLAEIF